MKKVSVEDIMGFHPCVEYTEDLVKNLFEGAEYLSLKEVREIVPGKDAVWVGINMMPVAARQELVFWMAKQALEFMDSFPGKDVVKEYVKTRNTTIEEDTKKICKDEVLHAHNSRYDAGMFPSGGVPTEIQIACWSAHILYSMFEDSSWEHIYTSYLWLMDLNQATQRNNKHDFNNICNIETKENNRILNKIDELLNQ